MTKLRVRRHYSLLLLILLRLLPAVAQEGDKADFLLVEHPQQLTILNKYEQQATPQEREQFSSFMPLRIIEESSFLSDGFTPCMRIRMDNSLFYVVLASGDSLRNQAAAGRVIQVRNTTLLGDNIEITAGNGLRVYPQMAAAGESRLLPATTHLRRLFSYRGETCLQTLEGKATFYWTKLPGRAGGNSWRRLEKTAASHIGLAAVRTRIDPQIDQANHFLQKLYEVLNRRSGSRENAPQWIVGSKAAEVLQLSLQGSGNYPQSSAVFLQRLRNSLRGSGYEATPDGETLIIQPGNGER